MVSAFKYSGEHSVGSIDPQPVLFKSACTPQANKPRINSLVLCRWWLCCFLVNVQWRMLAPEDMEKEPERGQEQYHANTSANQQRQERGRWTGSSVYRHSNRDQVRKLRQAPGSKNQCRCGKGQNTSQAIAPQEQRGGGSQSDQRCSNGKGKSVIEQAVP